MTAREQLPALLAARRQGNWSFWPLAECRSAGFPVTQVLDLAASDCAAAADRCCAAAAHADALWNALRRDVKARIREYLEQIRQLPPEQQADSPLHARLPPLRQAAKLIDRRRIDALADFVPPAQWTALHAAGTDLASAMAAYQERHAQAMAHVASIARRLVQEERFREAVTWQNARGAGTAFEAFDTADETSARVRRSVELVASYLQRYCTKNDTIGFFGPVGWAHFVPDAPALSLRPGPALLAQRHVYFEDWAIEALAQRLSARPELLAWMPARRMAFVRVERNRLHLPGGASLPLSAEESALLLACDGTRTARQIAALMLAQPFLGFDSEQEVYDMLAALQRQQRIHWGFAVRAADAYPERHLRDQLAAIDDAPLRENALAGLDRLEAARAVLKDAAGSATRTRAAIDALNDVFEDVAGVAASRRGGETYGARTVVYEDTVRDMQVELGHALAEQLHPPLDLVLTSARWYCHRLARLFQAEWHAIFDRIGASPSSGTARSAPFATFWLHAQALLFGAEALNTSALQQELCDKWATLLRLDDAPAAAPVQRASQELAAAVQASFAAPDCGWRSACHHSPDVMLAAADSDAINRGEFLFVLGEIHLGLNTLVNQSALNQAADAGAVLARLRADRRAPRLVPLLSRDGTRQPIRVQTVVDVGHDIELCFSHDVRPLHPATALNIGDLVVEEQAGALEVRTVDGKQRFALLDVFSEFLSGFAADKFRLLPPASHRARITLDRLVVQRASWRFACADLPFLHTANAADAYLALRQWCAEQRLPRWVFVKLPWEKKPFYVDFDSPLLAQMLIRQLRNAQARGETSTAQLSLSEMLPGHEQSWLRDAAGAPYTSELRLVAVQETDLPAAPGAPAGSPAA
ncbi:lantibiotic dehydratase [Pseudoduganella armeniaca]|uniref:Lantibiotic dehydratase N-terminal domain-containing protein n=1 Tax=Pseudoduganella armeniaca TaxID=2072590 RepID=A0A2R4CGZ2_9BURK|nr:lantibiotic dehydratase [Pseudoduganella armeniaca]AVR98929.1 hypothetical protein C9I28_27380 [Pseudoduganella armeniaca]